MVDLSALKPGDLANQMLGEAARIGGQAWNDIKTVATIEFKSAGQHIVEIAEAVGKKDIDQATAVMLFSMVRNNVIATIAMLTTKVVMAIQHIVDAALAIIATVVNKAIGFKLIG